MRSELSKFGLGHRGYDCRFVAALVVSALAALFVPLEQSQAQLFINVYPSQDNPTTQTLWIFSGSSTAAANNSIRTSGTYSSRDSWEPAENNGNFFDANKPNNQTLSLSPLFSSSNTADRNSVLARNFGRRQDGH